MVTDCAQIAVKLGHTDLAMQLVVSKSDEWHPAEKSRRRKRFTSPTPSPMSIVLPYVDASGSPHMANPSAGTLGHGGVGCAHPSLRCPGNDANYQSMMLFGSIPPKQKLKQHSTKYTKLSPGQAVNEIVLSP